MASPKAPAKRTRRRKAAPVAAIRTQALTKRFEYLTAVDDLDLEIDRGEVFGYLGPNGAGKTTTIRMFLDFIRPTSGSLAILDGTCADTRIRKRIGYLPGDLKLDQRYTSEDVFTFFGDLRGGVDTAYLDGLIERFELDPSRRLRQLSTGNRRKVGIIQAFMHRPELLILDEPTSGLDPLLQHEFQELVKECVGEGATVFLSSHVLHEVEELAGRVGILRKGKLIKVAGVEELRRQARQRADIYLPGRPDPAPFKRIPEVVEAVVHGDAVRLTMEGRIDGVLRVAGRLKAQRFVSLEADLEEVFLQFYAGDDE